jgi:anaerobic magnesium-protoporphyrin IX monomethyl ester cyclase
MTVLLTTLNAKYIHLNLAIRLLYSLNKHHQGLSWKEFTIKEKPDDIARSIAHFDVVAFSCYIWNITQTLAVARALKELNPDIKILLGGPEVSYDIEFFLNRSEVDFIITGEGEIPFGQFLDQYPHVSGIENLARKSDQGVQLVQKTTNFDLSNYAGINPYQWDDPTELAQKVSYIETSRGCPYKCEFCLASLDNKVRFLPNDDLKANLLYLMQHGTIIKFLDRTFNIKRDFTIDIFKFILAHRRPENIFQFEITADIVHPDIVQFIQEHVPPGVFRFEIGIQTVNQKANLEVSRKQNFEKTSSIIHQLRNKIEMHLDLIVGLPLDEWSDIQYSIEQVFALHPPELQLGFLKFLRGTPVRDKHLQHGFVFDPEPPYQIIESNYLSRAQLHAITELEEALEIYWNKKRAIHTLKYASTRYSIFEFLLGLGKYFAKTSDFHRHTINEVYDILNGFVASNYPDDSVLKALVSIDYYARPYLKPQIRYSNEVDRTIKSKIVEQQKLNHHLYRHIIIETPLSIASVEDQSYTMEPCYTVFEYNAKSTPAILSITIDLNDRTIIRSSTLQKNDLEH